ncbi:hypothetical protein [Clostridium manihotivorum]|uniref:Uncharacterized protein n=1 Tax=Clostridium manihotivorum TaxID=2320868 RepID=A0A3R5TIX9_9CLOT|nr:hypothetical protein [Clostridium manihotivorum]QAA34561.1 hypothetical protein C1I91_24625 [Clostridium manihotivorum]
MNKIDKLGKLWWLFAIVGVASTFLNPYVGFWGFINAIELFFLSIISLVLFTNEKVVEKHGMNNVLRVSIKSCVNNIYGLSVIFFLIKLFIGASIFIVGYKNNIIAAPYEIWSNPKQMSLIFLVLEMIFNVLLVISLISKGNTIKRMVNEYE